MKEKGWLEGLEGAELHFRLVSNDLLEAGKRSVTAVASGATDEAVLSSAAVVDREFGEYAPQGILGKLYERAKGRTPQAKERPGVVVVVEEKHGSISADDMRYVEWLMRTKGEAPRVVMVPEVGHKAGSDHEHPRHLLEQEEEKKIGSFWKRQWRRMKALPAPITRDAALAAIPRTAIPVGFSLFLAFLKRDEVPLERAMVYVGLAFSFAVGFALLNQTVLNWFTFWSEFTRDGLEPYVKSLHRWVSHRTAGFVAGLAGALMHLLSFVSARGDVFIAGPLLGIGCSYLARLALGPVGETTSVLTLYGFFLVVFNVVVGSIAGGPYPQVIAHLRAVGRISNRASMYFGILDTIKMETGRIADFGMQTLYNSIQVTFAVVFWALLLVVDRCYVKPDVHCLKHRKDIELARRLFEKLRQAESLPKPQAVAA